jgi:hypothetical protein
MTSGFMPERLAERKRPARMRGQSINVRGLSEFRREVAKVQREGGTRGLDLLKEHNYQIAAYVVRKAQQRAQTPPNSRIQQKAAASMRPRRGGDRAEIIGGNDRRRAKNSLGAAMPFFGAAEFGTYQNRLRRNIGGRPARAGHGWNAFLPWKRGGSGNSGYFLFPTMRAESDTIKRMYMAGLDRIMRDVFPD